MTTALPFTEVLRYVKFPSQICSNAHGKKTFLYRTTYLVRFSVVVEVEVEVARSFSTLKSLSKYARARQMDSKKIRLGIDCEEVVRCSCKYNPIVIRYRCGAVKANGKAQAKAVSSA